MNNHGVRKRTFYFRLYADTDTVIAVSRPGAADETITSGTDKSVPYDYRFKFRQNRYICQQCSAYGADIITPHLPQAVFQ